MAGSHRGGPSFYQAFHTIDELHCLHDLPQFQRLRQTHPSTPIISIRNVSRVVRHSSHLKSGSGNVISSLVCILENLVQIKCLNLTRTRWAILPTSVKAAIIKAADQNPNLVVQLSVSNVSPTDFVPLFSECKSLNFMDTNNKEQSPLIEKLPTWKKYPPKLTRLEFDSTFPGVDTLVEYYPKMFSILRHFRQRATSGASKPPGLSLKSHTTLWSI